MRATNTIRTAIIPDRVSIRPTADSAELDRKAICIFAATGFFLEADTYFRNQRALQPATSYEVDEQGRIRSAHRYWNWHYAPREITLSQATDEFAHLFERITREGTAGRRIILPLSGGLDSRTQAAVLGAGNVQAYSYRFCDSFDETRYGARIAKQQRYPFRAFVIPRGYLWRVIDELAALNGCYADFTHPRQVAVMDEISPLGDVFYLGHWGDVLFDDMGVASNLPFDAQLKAVLDKIVRTGGRELAVALWQAWGLDGTFDAYLRERVVTLLRDIDIDDANARIRAFKSMYWAPRWTTANLVTFSSRHPLALPYYHDDMCKLVCTIPERHLAGRQIQIEYLKRAAPALARIPWQSFYPLDLYNYKHYYSYRMLPYRAARKLGRALTRRLSGKNLVTRNWEIQFLGADNDARLRAHLFEHDAFRDMIPAELVTSFYAKFASGKHVQYAHPISMLLTLSLFARTRRDSSRPLV